MMEFPPVFHPAFYRANNADLREMDDAALDRHYREFGIGEGRAGSAPAGRDGLSDLLIRHDSILEIGPWFKPFVRGPKVKYFDVYPRDELMAKARDVGGNPDDCPEIHYMSRTGDLTLIPDRFAAVFSAHTVEHQPDLVRHLQTVAGLLTDGGCYYLIIPDKRYCFDYFLPESTIADVLDAHLRGRQLHDPRDILNYCLLRTHNEPMRHWQGDHGERLIDADPSLLRSAIAEAARYDQGYIDTHAWRFTPGSFEAITNTLFELGLTALEPARVYNPLCGTSEFMAILRSAR